MSFGLPSERTMSTGRSALSRASVADAWRIAVPSRAELDGCAVQNSTGRVEADSVNTSSADSGLPAIASRSPTRHAVDMDPIDNHIGMLVRSELGRARKPPLGALLEQTERTLPGILVLR